MDLTLTPEQQVWFERAKRFIEFSQFKPVEVELSHTSEALRFGGTLDAIGSFGRKFWKDDKKFFQTNRKEFDADSLWLVDWKVAKSWDDLHPLQGVGYSLLYNELKGTQLDWFVIVKISKEAAPKEEVETRCYYLPDYYEEFEACRKIWDLQNKSGKWECLRKRKR
jgi:hypothetical protein